MAELHLAEISGVLELKIEIRGVMIQLFCTAWSKMNVYILIQGETIKLMVWRIKFLFLKGLQAYRATLVVAYLCS